MKTKNNRFKTSLKTKNNRFKTSLLKNRDCLVDFLEEEWKEAEDTFAKQERKDQLINFVKNAGDISGRALLGILLMGGILVVAAAAPGIFGAYGPLSKRRYYFKKDKFNKEKYYLKRHGFIKIDALAKDKLEIVLSQRGLQKALGIAFKDFKLRRPEPDGDWRVVMFDIPRKYNWARDIFRQKLRELGFYQFQMSVFILPYPCEREVGLLSAVLNISHFVRIIKTKDFSELEHLKEFFGIK